MGISLNNPVRFPKKIAKSPKNQKKMFYAVNTKNPTSIQKIGTKWNSKRLDPRKTQFSKYTKVVPIFNLVKNPQEILNLLKSGINPYKKNTDFESSKNPVRFYSIEIPLGTEEGNTGRQSANKHYNQESALSGNTFDLF